jgi:REP element-mobilizing transposase RayT
MSTGCQIKDQFGHYFCTFTIAQWADIFSRRIYRDIVTESLNYCSEQKGLQVHAYVFMTNHIHTILSGAQGNLSGIIRDMKSFTSKRIYAEMMEGIESRRDWLSLVFKYAAGGHNRNENFQVWTHENHPEEIISTEFLRCKMDYLHMNPVKAGWVSEPQHWTYSSAADYFFGKQVGPVKVSLLDM